MEELVLTLYSVIQHTELLSLSPPHSTVCVCVFLHSPYLYPCTHGYRCQLPQARCEQRRVQAVGWDRHASVWAGHLCSHTAWLAAAGAVGGDRAGRNWVSASEIKRANHFLWDSAKYCSHPCPYVRLFLPLVHSPLSLIPKLHHRWIPFKTTDFCHEPHKITVKSFAKGWSFLCCVILYYFPLNLVF